MIPPILIPSQVSDRHPTLLSQSSIHHNHPAFSSSDRQFVGDSVPAKSSHTLRLYFSNVNGISSYQHFQSIHPLMDSLHSLQADIMCLVEHNLAIEKPHVQCSDLISC